MSNIILTVMKPTIIIPLMALIATGVTAQELKYPEAPRSATTDTYFGVEVKDPYLYIDNDNNVDTYKWREVERKVTEE